MGSYVPWNRENLISARREALCVNHPRMGLGLGKIPTFTELGLEGRVEEIPLNGPLGADRQFFVYGPQSGEDELYEGRESDNENPFFNDQG